jgi:hypothetical protein
MVMDMNNGANQMSTKSTKFVARYEGKIVGTRKSPRPYAFAIVAKHNEAAEREAAYGRKTTKTDAGNFDYYIKCATGTYNGTFGDGRSFTSKVEGKTLERALAVVALGYEGYIADLKARAIADFEERLAKGHFEPGVFGWSMSRANADKLAKQVAPILLAIVPAETV